MKNCLYLLVFIVINSCNNKPQQETTAGKETSAAVVTLTEAQMKKAGIVTGAITIRSVHTRLQVNGVVDVPPQSMISVSVPLGGYLKSTRLLPGSKIRKGEVLAVLEDPQYIQLQQEYLVSRARLSFAEADFKRQQELNATQAASDKALQLARSEYDKEKVMVKSLAAKLALVNINANTLNENTITKTVPVFSPINGFVSRVNVNIGKYVSPTDVLFELVDPSDLHLNLTVFEKDAAQLAVGQRVTAYSNHQPDEKHEAKVFLISRNVNEDRAVNVHCHFEAYDPLLLPGMYMNAIIDVNNRQMQTVPDDAVVRWQNKFYVFAEKQTGVFEMVEVQPGASSDGYTAISPVGGQPLELLRLVVQHAYTLLMKLKNSAEDE